MEDDILKKIYELNEIGSLSSTERTKYFFLLEKIKKDIPLSQKLGYSGHGDIELSRLGDRVPSILKNVFQKNGIDTVGKMLDITRKDAYSFSACGERKWMEIWKLQKQFIEAGPQSPRSSDTKIVPYCEKELEDIVGRILALENIGLKAMRESSELCLLKNSLRERGQKMSDIFKGTALENIPKESILLGTQLDSTCQSLGINRLVDILDISVEDIRNTPGKGTTAWSSIIKTKQKIMTSSQEFVERYEKSGKKYVLPILAPGEENLPLYIKIHMALKSMCEILEKTDMHEQAFMLNQFFFTSNTTKQISSILGLHHERVRQLKELYITRLLNLEDNTIAPNLRLSPAIISKILSTGKELRYKSLDYIQKQTGATDREGLIQLLPIFGLKAMRISESRYYLDQDYAIPIGASILETYNTYYRPFWDVLSKEAMPLEKDEVISRIRKEKDGAELDNGIIETILTSHKWIEKTENSCYQMEYGHLRSNFVKIARIIYEHKTVTNDQLVELNRKYTGHTDNKFIQSLSLVKKDFSWITNPRPGVWEYQGKNARQNKPLIQAIREYAEEKKIFKVSQMMEDLKKIDAYKRYSDSSFRTYVLTLCQPNNKDNDLVCLSTHIGDNNDGQWRVRSVQGTTNWVLRRCIEILSGEPGAAMPKKQLNRMVMNSPEIEKYNIKDISHTLSCYSSKNGNRKRDLFSITEDGIVCLKKGMMTKLELDEIGIANKQPAYYDKVRECIRKSLEESPEGIMTLKELSHKCTSILEKVNNKNIFYKIIRMMPDIKREKDGNTTWVSLV